ncbi:MAG TPA: hypothetical protein VMF29_07680 [Candidatus Edwardsbacteria bacterium]|nr:hypothetical protein [Candidatus Edwardsbacteria bacterium]
MRWSEWHPRTADELDQDGQSGSGVYPIALCGAKLRYPQGSSSVIFTGAAPGQTLPERLKVHLRGTGNRGAYRRYKNSERMRWRILITGNCDDGDEKAVPEFLAAFGRLPV